MIPRLLLLSLAAAAAAALGSGCGSSTRAFAPSETAAREALETSLSAWQKGRKPDQVATDAAPIHPVDGHWQAGEVLESYKIVAEEPQPGEEDATKRFSVALKMKAAKDETSTHYIVLGRNPIWVYRDQDYERLVNMEDNPRAAAKRKRP